MEIKFCDKTFNSVETFNIVEAVNVDIVEALWISWYVIISQCMCVG